MFRVRGVISGVLCLGLGVMFGVRVVMFGSGVLCLGLWCYVWCQWCYVQSMVLCLGMGCSVWVRGAMFGSGCYFWGHS